MDPDTPLPTPLLAFALLAANAYFVIAEFTLLTLHRSGVDPGLREGRLRAVLPRADEMLLVAQLGSSAATLLLGYHAATLVHLWLQPGRVGAAGGLAAGVAVVWLTHALLGAQMPKLYGIHLGALPGTRVLLPLRALTALLHPVVWLLSRLVRAGLRVLGVHNPGFQPLSATPDEIRNLVVQGHAQGVVEADEREMIHGVLEFTDTVAREVMTPRIDIVAVPVDATLAHLIDTLVVEGHSRLPVYEGSIDTVVGVLLAKDLLPLLARSAHAAQPFDLRRVMREPYFVPGTKPVDDLLAEFRQKKVHLAIVLDEFGGTHGLVTMEDLLEEIVGEINDEYDEAEPDFAPTPEGDVLIDGGTLISEVNERFGLSLPEEDFDTIGGYIFGALGRVAEPGDVVQGTGEDAGVALHVEETEERRVTRVRLTRAAAERATVPEP